MALKLCWTPRAISGYDKIVSYLQQHWTDREVKNFIHESDDFFTLLSEFPELLQKTDKFRNLYRGPMNKFTIITYRVKPRKHQIEIINVRSARQKPSK
jgi:plasmid stabilization system protein ParE